MVKDEAAFWKVVREAAVRNRGFVRKLPAEGFAGKGTPDGFFCLAGDITVAELKYVPAWPVRPDTDVAVKLTEHQNNWLAELVSPTHGGRGFVVVGVADDWFLLRMHELGPANEFPIRLPQAQLRESLFRGKTTKVGLDRLIALLAQASPRA
jgi:hypothetical protein